MTEIDSNARIADGAKIGRNVFIGPYCIVGPDVVLADEVKLVSHASVAGHTSIGARTTIYPFASLGTPPQSVKYRGGPPRLVIGADCDIREGVTMNTGTEDDRGVTEVGDRCFFMAGSHVAHDCKIGDRVTMANNTVLGGHVTVGSDVVFGGQAAVHQFVRIGEGAMIAGVSGATSDVIPYGFANGPRARLDGLNVVGLRRRGLTRSDLHRLRGAYQALFLGEGEFAARLEAVRAEFQTDPYVAKILAFVGGDRKRPLMGAMHRGNAAKAMLGAADLP